MYSLLSNLNTSHTFKDYRGDKFPQITFFFTFCQLIDKGLNFKNQE